MVGKLCAVLLLALVLPVHGAAGSIAYSRAKVGKLVAHTVTVNLADPDVRVSVALARKGAGSSENFSSLVGRTRPTAAITGTFYDTRTLLPTGDIALFGTLVHKGCIGSALCIDGSNRPAILSLEAGRLSDWSGCETVLCAGPVLVARSKVAIALRHEGFRSSLLAPTRRTAVGITKHGKLLMVVINRPASLYALASAMIKLNCTDALCLDGGSSTALYHGGRYYATPTRRMTNCLVAYPTDAAYQQARTRLAPARCFAATEPAQAPEAPAVSASAKVLQSNPPSPAWRPTSTR